MAEWSMATDCKSVDESLPWFKSMFHHHFFADLAQPAEHIHGKDGVFGSNPKIGSTKMTRHKPFEDKKFNAA